MNRECSSLNAVPKKPQVKTGKTEKLMNMQQLLKVILILDLDYELAQETRLVINQDPL